MRKITQVAVSDKALYAVCADGSLWAINGGDVLWTRMPDIPDDGQPEKKRAPRAGTTIAQFLADCKEKGEQAIPTDHPIMTYALEAKIPDEFLRLHWLEFKERHVENKKTYKDWRAAFGNSVRGNWFKFWYFDAGECKLNTAGQQAQNRMMGKA
jgi:hypothetical protein